MATCAENEATQPLVAATGDTQPLVAESDTQRLIMVLRLPSADGKRAGPEEESDDNVRGATFKRRLVASETDDDVVLPEQALDDPASEPHAAESESDVSVGSPPATEDDEVNDDMVAEFAENYVPGAPEHAFLADFKAAGCRSDIVVISGPWGSGKSILALYVARLAADAAPAGQRTIAQVSGVPDDLGALLTQHAAVVVSLASRALFASARSRLVERPPTARATLVIVVNTVTPGCDIAEVLRGGQFAAAPVNRNWRHHHMRRASWDEAMRITRSLVSSNQLARLLAEAIAPGSEYGWQIASRVRAHVREGRAERAARARR